MKDRRAVTVSFAGKLLALVALSATAQCGMLIGIEDLNTSGNDAAGGAGGTKADAANTSGAGGTGGSGGAGATGGTGATGGMGGSTGGAAGSGGTSNQDAALDTRSDVQLDVTIDTRVDAGSDAPPSDVADERSPDAPVPDGGTADTGTADSGDVSNGNDVSDGNAPDGTSPDAGTLDVGAPDAPVSDATVDHGSTVTVQGKIVDYWRHPLANVPVTIGTAVATTDQTGQFSITGVTPPYDVFFTISTTVNNTAAKYGWLYKGLTRTNPTLQVGRGLPERSANPVTVNTTSIDFTNLPATHAIHGAVGGPDGAFDFDIDGSPLSPPITTWYGPTMTTMTTHALHWTRATSTSLDPPTGYTGYDTHSVQFTDALAATVNFDLPTVTVPPATLAGSVTASQTGGQRENDVYVRFDDNAVIQLTADITQPTTYSYVVPSIAQSTITFAASQGSWYSPPYAVIHKDGIVAGQAGPTLQVPDTPSLVAPADSATGVNGSTLFRWSGSAKVFLWAISFGNEYKGIFVVTTEKQGMIANMPDGPALPQNAPFSWWVETDGDYQTVDDATGTSGMLDSFRTGVLWGAIRGDGSYTSSEENNFTSAP